MFSSSNDRLLQQIVEKTHFYIQEHLTLEIENISDLSDNLKIIGECLIFLQSVEASEVFSAEVASIFLSDSSKKLIILSPSTYQFAVSTYAYVKSLHNEEWHEFLRNIRSNMIEDFSDLPAYRKYEFDSALISLGIRERTGLENRMELRSLLPFGITRDIAYGITHHIFIQSGYTFDPIHKMHCEDMVFLRHLFESFHRSGDIDLCLELCLCHYMGGGDSEASRSMLFECIQLLNLKGHVSYFDSASKFDVFSKYYHQIWLFGICIKKIGHISTIENGSKFATARCAVFDALKCLSRGNYLVACEALAKLPSEFQHEKKYLENVLRVFLHNLTASNIL